MKGHMYVKMFDPPVYGRAAGRELSQYLGQKKENGS